MQCSFDGCAGKSHSKGLCGSHYAQQRVGKPLAPLQQQFHGLSEQDRFWKWVSKMPNGCWRWMGSIKRRKNRPQSEWHGQWRNAAGEIELTHRASWRMLVGDIPRGGLILHRCDNPRCVNPDHLFIGTQADNVADMWDKGRARPGKSAGESHGRSKLTEQNVREIRVSGDNGSELASRYGVSTSVIYSVLKGTTWKHVR